MLKCPRCAILFFLSSSYLLTENFREGMLTMLLPLQRDTSNDLSPPISIHSFSSKESKRQDLAQKERRLSIYSTWSALLNDFYRFQSDTWAFEVFSILLSVAALVLVILVLKYYDGKPAPEWPYALNLNAFTSFAMMVMGAALTVPVSNGLGQLKWILAQSGDVSVVDLDNIDRATRGIWGSVYSLFTWTGGFLGAFGSIITIITFGAAPFAQQAILSAEGGIETVNDSSSLVATCGSGSDLRNVCTGASIEGAAAKGLNVVPSLLRGGYYNSIYGTYNRSAVQSGLTQCPTGNCTWAPFTTLSVCSKCVDVTQFLQFNGSTSSLLEDQLISLPGGPTLAPAFDTFAMSKTTPSSRILTNNITAYTFGIISVAAGNKSVVAIECRFNFCVQLLSSSLSGGVYNETVLKDFEEHSFKMGVKKHAPSERSFDDYYEFGPLKDDSGVQYAPISLENDQPLCLGALVDFQPREELPLTELGIDNVPSVVDNIAVSAGRAIRTVCDNGTNLNGSSWKTLTLVRIDWPWMSLPIAVEIMGVVFFVVISLLSTRYDTKLWKSSLVAAIFHSFDTCEVDGSLNLESLFGMEQTAEKTRVRLQSAGNQQHSKLTRH